MEEFDIIRKVKDGDFAAFENWMGNHHRNIERFAFQNGCTQEQASQLVEDTFREIYNELGILDFQMRNIYKMVLEKITILQLTIPLLDDVFRFEEDAELHSAIIHLDEKYRIPLVLQVFHGMDNEQVAGLTDLPISEVEVRIHAARELLGKVINGSSPEILEKRFEFLGKSYDRLPLLFNADNVVRKESAPVDEEHKKWGRNGWITAVILGVLLIGLVGSTYFTGEDWEFRSDRKYIEGLKKEFAEQMADKQKILGVSDEVVNQIPFIAEANIQITQLLKELEDKNSKGEKIDRQLAEAWFLEQTEVMKLPSELADELFAAPLVNDIGQSMMFAEVYFVKLDAVKYVLYNAFDEEYSGVREAFKTGLVDAEAILAQPDVYSESTIQAIKAITSQHIELVWNEEIVWRDVSSEFAVQLRAALHESAGSYLTQYERDPFILNDRLLYSLDDTIGFIKEMEQTIIGAKQNGWMGHSMEWAMVNLLEAIVQGKTMEEFNNSDGSISEVHRNAWRELASFGSDSGVGVMMTKIVEEMEASDWRHSEFHNSLKDYRIYEAYSFASRNELEQFGLEPFQVKVTYNEKIFKLPNKILDNTVADLYDEFSRAYDRTVLGNVHPLFIVGLFYYANDKGDAAMMWHLTDPESRTSSIEEYTVREIALLEVTDSILFNPSMIMANGGTTTAPIEFERNGKTFYNVWMTYGEGHVWQIESIVIEEGSL